MMIKWNVFLSFECNNTKCQVCVKSKYVKNPYKFVEWNSYPSELINTYICDMKPTPSCGSKTYFIAFIDDYIIYCYVYLLNGKDDNRYN